MRLAQSETYYPHALEPANAYTGVGFGIMRKSDGQWWDFDDSSFKNAGWVDKFMAMDEDDSGMWYYGTGWAIPDANATYVVLFEAVDDVGTYYRVGPEIIVNDAIGVVPILADTNELQTNQGNWATVTGHATEAKQDVIDGEVGNIKTVTDALTSAAAAKLALSAGTIVSGTVSHDNTAATTTVFYSDDITEATADHYNGRIVIFTSGDLQYQATDITDYALDTGEGKFTVTALTEAPADNVTFIIV